MSDFFGLTSDYKPIVLEETFIVMQQLKTGYMDVMSMPVYERRFFINILLKQQEKQQEYVENNSSTPNANAKGTRKSKISGDALKSKMKSGEIPLN
jgi:hypothetical protein